MNSLQNLVEYGQISQKVGGFSPLVNALGEMAYFLMNILLMIIIIISEAYKVILMERGVNREYICELGRTLTLNFT